MKRTPKGIGRKYVLVAIALAMNLTALRISVQAQGSNEKIKWRNHTRNGDVTSSDGIKGETKSWESPTYVDRQQEILTENNPTSAAATALAVGGALLGVLGITAATGNKTNKDAVTGLKSETAGVWIAPEDREKVLQMINSCSNKQYTIDTAGYLKADPNKSINAAGSETYSAVLDELIGGKKRVVISLDTGWTTIDEKTGKIKEYEFEDGNAGITIGGNKTNQVVVIDSKDDPEVDKSMILAHELTHALRGDYGLQTDSPAGGGVNKVEEAYAVQVEDKIRYELGKQLRTDGDSRLDVNKDGKADGDSSYGNFEIEVPAADWYNNVAKSTVASGIGSVYKFNDDDPPEEPPEDTPPEDTPPEDTPPEDTPPEDTPPEDTPPEDTPPEDTPPEDTPPEDTPPEDTPPEDTPPEDTPPEDTPPEDTPPEDTPPADTPPTDTPTTEDTPGGNQATTEEPATQPTTVETDPASTGASGNPIVIKNPNGEEEGEDGEDDDSGDSEEDDDESGTTTDGTNVSNNTGSNAEDTSTGGNNTTTNTNSNGDAGGDGTNTGNNSTSETGSSGDESTTTNNSETTSGGYEAPETTNNEGGTTENNNNYANMITDTPQLTYDPNTYSPAVSTLQTVLGVDSDGYFGDNTLQVVKDFQTSHGLDADGIVGPLTWAAILGDILEKTDGGQSTTDTTPPSVDPPPPTEPPVDIIQNPDPTTTPTPTTSTNQDGNTTTKDNTGTQVQITTPTTTQGSGQDGNQNPTQNTTNSEGTDTTQVKFPTNIIPQKQDKEFTGDKDSIFEVMNYYGIFYSLENLESAAEKYLNQKYVASVEQQEQLAKAIMDYANSQKGGTGEIKPGTGNETTGTPPQTSNGTGNSTVINTNTTISVSGNNNGAEISVNSFGNKNQVVIAVRKIDADTVKLKVTDPKGNVTIVDPGDNGRCQLGMVYDFPMVGEYKIEVITTDIKGNQTTGGMTFPISSMPSTLVIPTLTPEQQAIIKSKENLARLGYKGLRNEKDEFDASWPGNYNHALVDFMYAYGVRSQYTNDRQQLFNWIQQAVNGELTPDPIVIAKKNLEKIGYNPPKNEEDCYDDSWPEDGEFNSILGQFINEYGFSEEYANTPESEKRQVLFEWIQEAADNKLQKSELIEIKRKLDNLERIEGFANDRLKDKTGQYSRLWNDSDDPNDDSKSVQTPINHFLSYYGIYEEYKQETEGKDSEEINDILLKYLNEAESGVRQPAAQATAKKNLKELGYDVKNCSDTASGMIYDDTWPGAFDTVLAGFKEKYGLYTKYNNEPGDKRNLKLFDWIKDAVDGSLQPSKEVQIRELYDILQSQGKVKKATVKTDGGYYSAEWDGDGATSIDILRQNFFASYGIDEKCLGEPGSDSRDVIIDYLQKAVSGEIQPLDKTINISLVDRDTYSKAITVNCESAKSIQIKLTDPEGEEEIINSADRNYVGGIIDYSRAGIYTITVTVTDLDGEVRKETRTFNKGYDFAIADILKSLTKDEALFLANARYSTKCDMITALQMLTILKGWGSNPDKFDTDGATKDLEEKLGIPYYSASLAELSYRASVWNKIKVPFQNEDADQIVKIGDSVTFLIGMYGFAISDALINGENISPLFKENSALDQLESKGYIPPGLKSPIKLTNVIKEQPSKIYELAEEIVDDGNNLTVTLKENGEVVTLDKAKLEKQGINRETIDCIGGKCFAGDTPVLTKEGFKRIDEIKEGELVFAKNIDTDEIGLKKVMNVYLSSTMIMVNLKVGNEEIKATPVHPFYVSNYGWREAAKLKVGDKIVTFNGDEKEITSIKLNDLKESEKIYNLNVEEYHTYFVSNESVLVHNAKRCTPEMIEEARNNLTYTGGRTQTELDDLARDPSSGGKIETKNLREREVGLDLEKRGILGRIVRDTQATKGAEFIDTTTNAKWDVKSFESYPCGDNGIPITNPKDGAFEVNTAMKKIQRELNEEHGVIIDTLKLNPEHIDQLKNAIKEGNIPDDKIIWYYP